MGWKEENMRFFCLALPFVGAVLGGLWWAALMLLSQWSVSPFLRGAVMTLYALSLTGGMHMDGLMDTCDAIFSRRDLQTRLRILSDPHTGAFAVMGCVSVLMLQWAAFAELLTAAPSSRGLGLVAVVPIWSRLGAGFLLNDLPPAREDGLARMQGVYRTPSHTPRLCLMALALGGLNLWLGIAALPIVWAGALLLWRRCCLAVFGGVTGDLLGAFVELSETAMLLALVGLL